ncbi:MAG: OmpA family protein [Alphaproteobacteria bacterium]|jgi:outer membrane protein OmpA-like peptidoglycan-associated protein|nr:OmpA family protein [Alphaproteobacteria bacterium]
MLRLIGLGLAGLVLAGCATTIESDSRLESARQAVETAEASGMAADRELAEARSYLSETEEAYESGEEFAYEANSQLTTAFADLAVTKGELDALRGSAQGMEEALNEARAARESCSNELDSVRRQLQQCRTSGVDADLAALGEALGAFDVRETANGTMFTLRKIGFSLESAALSGEARERLSALADYLAANPGMRVRIEGHTDTTGPTEYNQRLSERRAQSVADLMTENGVAARRITASGQGESNPVASNDNRAGRIANRRVEITLMSGDGASG